MMYKKFILSLAACAVSVRATTFHGKVKDGKFQAVNQDPLYNQQEDLNHRNKSAAPPVTPNVWTLSGKRWRKPTISLGEGLIPDEKVQELCSTARDPDLNTGRVTVLGYAGARTGYYADFEGVGRIHQFKEKDNFQCTGNVWWAPCNLFSDWKPPAPSSQELREEKLRKKLRERKRAFAAQEALRAQREEQRAANPDAKEIQEIRDELKERHKDMWINTEEHGKVHFQDMLSGIADEAKRNHAKRFSKPTTTSSASSEQKEEE